MVFPREIGSFLPGFTGVPAVGDAPASVPSVPRQAPSEPNGQSRGCDEHRSVPERGELAELPHVPPPPHVLDHLAGRIALHRRRHASENAVAPGLCSSVVDALDMGATPGAADAPPLVRVRIVSPGRRGTALERTSAFTPHLARGIAHDARAVPGARVELIVEADAPDEVFTHIAQEAFVLFCTRGLEVAVYRAATAKPQRHGPAPPSRAA